MSEPQLPAAAPRALHTLLADFAAGRKAALARAVSMVEDRRAGADLLLAALHSRVGRARRIGLTGPPGAGKSTLTSRIAAAWREQGHTVGIVAVDPTSPFSGGALLGDRVRMESVALDAGVFIRSMATRGSLGGLAGATREVCDVLDAFGLDRILIETVGVGQSELDIARTADTSLLVLVPEAGDSIQTLKAGLMEIADVFVVNKADRPGADRLRNDIDLMLGLRGGHLMKNVPARHGVDLRSLGRRPATEAVVETGDAETWSQPVLRAVGTTGEGLPEMLAALDAHFAYLERSGELDVRRRARLRERVKDVVFQRLARRLWNDAATNAWIDAQVADLATGRTTPYAVADELLRQSGPLMTGETA
ncbi:MAG TPA: methylmalonyl Co-A mutase-associated GTPase MeaB [Gemmatimonadaceae bacterium]